MNLKKDKAYLRLPQNRPPVHPGEILAEEFMLPYHLTQQQLAQYLKISRKHLIDIIHAHKAVSLEVAQRLAKLFQTSVDFWIQGQVAYDIWYAQRHPSKEVKTIKPLKLSIN